MAMNWTKRFGQILNNRRLLVCTGLATLSFGVCGMLRSPLSAEPQKVAARVGDAQQDHPLVPALKLVSQSLTALENVRDYEATLVKQERVGNQLLTAKMEMKFRENPRSVYLKFVEPHGGREVLYRPDTNNGKLLVKDVGLAALVGSVSLDPNGTLAMKENRYPISQIGLKRLMELVRDQWIKETKVADTTVNYYPNAKIGGVPCRVIEVSHSRRHPDVLNHITRIYFDAVTNMPVRIQNYDYPANPGEKPQLVEDYYYMNLKMNAGLTDADFDRNNSAYRF